MLYLLCRVDRTSISDYTYVNY